MRPAKFDARLRTEVKFNLGSSFGAIPISMRRNLFLHPGVIVVHYLHFLVNFLWCCSTEIMKEKRSTELALSENIV